MPVPFLDTNIFIRHLMGDHNEHSPKATNYLKRIESKQLKVKIADSVVFETVYTLQKTYKQTKTEIRDAVLPLIELHGIILPGKRKWKEIFDLYVNLNIPIVDAYQAIVMNKQRIKEIVSFDRDYDRIPGIARIEPQ